MINIPFFIIVALMLLQLGKDFARHGESRTVIEDGWVSLIAFVIMICILTWAVTWGGIA